MSGYLPANKTSLKSRGDYGIRVAKYGYDAYNCNDGQLLFNSNWPIIQIAKMQKIDKPAILIGATPEPVITTSEPYVLFQEYDKDVAGVDRKYVYTKAHIKEYRWTEIKDYRPILHSFFQVTLYGLTHNLGYTPMFFSEEDFNGNDATQNRVVLTNIDITEDVDYPYLNVPSINRSYSGDYGIKSKAYYSRDFPKTGTRRGVGLDTAIQGKQIQAIKTQKTIAEDGWEVTQSPSCVYYPPKDTKGNYYMTGDKFEYYGYVSNILACLRSPSTFNAGGGMGAGDVVSNVFGPLKFGHGDVYFRTIVLPLPAALYTTPDTIEGGYLASAYDMGYGGQGDWAKQSLVVVRMPMVAPDVVEVEVV